MNSKYKELYTEEYINKLSNQDIFKISRLLQYISFNKSDVVVDYGCGDGKLALLIGDKVKEYHGVDFSEGFIKEALEKNQQKSNIFFHCKDIIKYSKANLNKFDKAFAFDFTEHIYDKDFEEIFSAIKRTLKPNGKLYIHTPNGNYFIELLKKVGILKQFPEHVAVRNATQNGKIFEKIGFSNWETKYIPHYNKYLKWSHHLTWLPIIGKYFKARLFIICEK
jgi:cyclopropane fatty-acyl-phospholipid synthase-like methyltransferase